MAENSALALLKLDMYVIMRFQHQHLERIILTIEELHLQFSLQHGMTYLCPEWSRER